MATNQYRPPSVEDADFISLPSRENNGYPFGIALTPKQVEPRKELATELGKLNQAYEQLKAIIDRMEQAIIDTWTPALPSERHSMLARFREAIEQHEWLFNEERPDLHVYFMKRADRKSFTNTQLEGAACMPMLSSKLWKGTNLLELLRSRGRNHPHVFFLRDLHRVELAIRYKVLKHKNTDIHHWAIHPDEEGITRNDCYEFERGYNYHKMPERLEIAVDIAARVYTIQTHLLQHLKILAELVLSMAFPDKTKEHIDQMVQRKTVEPEPALVVSTFTKSQMKKIKPNQPQYMLELESNLLYGVPHPPDYQWLYSQAKARASSSADLLTSARTYPMDLLAQAREVNEVNLYNSPIFKGCGAQLKKNEDKHWNFTYKIVFKKLLFTCFAWSEISTALAEFLEFRTRMEADPGPQDGSEPRRDLQHYEKFHRLFMMVRVGQRLMQQFYAECMPHAPEFTKFYIGDFIIPEEEQAVLPKGTNSLGTPIIKLRPNALSNKLHAGLYRLTQIDQKPDWSLKGGFAPVIDNILPIYASDTDRDKLTESLVFIFDNLIALTNIEKALYADHETFFGYHRALYWDKLTCARKDFNDRFERLGTIFSTIGVFEMKNANLDGLAHDDVERSREFEKAYEETRANAKRSRFEKAYKQTRDAQAHADRIWNAFEDEMLTNCRKYFRGHVGSATGLEQISGFGFWVPRAHIPRLPEEIPSPPTITRARQPPTAPTQAERPSQTEAQAAEPSPEVTTSRKRPSDNPDHAEEGPAKKVKTKTRPPEDQVGPAPSEPAQEPEPEHKFNVYLCRAYETSQTLFDHAFPLPGKMAWNKIRELMSEMGYEEEPSGGSSISYTVATKRAKAAFTGEGAHIIMHRYHRPGLSGMAEKQVLRNIVKALEDRCQLDADRFKETGPSHPDTGPDVKVEDDKDDEKGQRQQGGPRRR